MSEGTSFPNYLQIPPLLPQRAWHVLRILTVLAALTMAVLLITQPKWALPLFWMLVVPLLPAVFMIAPGLWRNLCPMAALNQTPRLFGFSRGLAHTPRIREYSYVLGIALFFLFVSSRKWLFDQNGVASGALILFGLGAAFVGGLVFKGKSGWCSSICPLLPIQRIYGQTPLKLIGNAHCQPCVGCTKNCYDFNPKVAFLADQYDDDRYHAGYRRFFAAALPGFILAFFTMPNAVSPLASTAATLEGGAIYTHFLLYAGVGMALYKTCETFLKVPVNSLNVLFGAAAFNIYYWFAASGWFAALSTLSGQWAVPVGAPYLIRVPLWIASAMWIWHGFATEGVFRRELAGKSASQAAGVGQGAVAALRKASGQPGMQLVIEPELQKVAATQGQSLLELVESCGARIESGCRMGVCGADPVAVLGGMNNLSPPDEDECNTLARLGHADNTRMACRARVQKGEVAIALVPDKRDAGISANAAAFDPAIRQVVVIGNGIAGVTAADHLRRRHPACRIVVVADENHHLYNRMAITRLVYGRSAMQGLYLMPESWYAERNIEVMLNTAVRSVDAKKRELLLADGETLRYDRLIFATGSSSFVPQLPGYGGPGCYVLRSANDAMGLRSQAQTSGATHAVVAGGGLLGLEAAYALYKLGMQVAVIERNRWLLHRQLDERGGRLLESYLANLGLHICTAVQIKALTRGEDGLRMVQLDGSAPRRADLFVVAAGIAPNIELARVAGLDVNRGIVVDWQMRTSIADVYAAGDAAEVEGKVLGLWPVAVGQAEVAACNALGETRSYEEPVLSTQLKVVGADLVSVGKFEVGEGETSLSEEDVANYRYRKLVLRDGVLVGAILIGWPELIEPVSKAVKAHKRLDGAEAQIRAGDWSYFACAVSAAA
ncbi:FAD-dependent oxidoreductase [Janthinobacterium sp. 17J80-10]|uniref:FAD-dependent oxidoreductase n=1 Tax=Janthinobacterium sp. 17J80-10 TaxID=2497863 RepID=UPI0010056BBC|nr:FAD-dependent oxidoreductase [Janthinobacterium sp. 17J80-10]QAU35649.1 2Fe-2S iron-sulfur cluster binding domain-containing protein [Janthinobacterium sp. 17J80-10]